MSAFLFFSLVTLFGFTEVPPNPDCQAPELLEAIEEASQEVDFPAWVLMLDAMQETRCRNDTTNKYGFAGYFQLKPIYMQNVVKGFDNPKDPKQAAIVTALLMKKSMQTLQTDDYFFAFLADNMGTAHVRRCFEGFSGDVLEWAKAHPKRCSLPARHFKKPHQDFLKRVSYIQKVMNTYETPAKLAVGWKNTK